MPRADFVTAVVLILLGLGVVAESLRMPTLEHLGVNPYTAPGVVPGLLGCVIGGLGLVLLLRAARAGGWRLDLPTGGLAAGLRTEGARRLGLTLLLTLGYAAGLVGRVPFWLATFVFVFLFAAMFSWRREQAARVLAVAAALGAVTAFVITLVFEQVFLVRLP